MRIIQIEQTERLAKLIAADTEFIYTMGFRGAERWVQALLVKTGNSVFARSCDTKLMRKDLARYFNFEEREGELLHEWMGNAESMRFVLDASATSVLVGVSFFRRKRDIGHLVAEFDMKNPVQGSSFYTVDRAQKPRRQK